MIGLSALPTGYFPKGRLLQTIERVGIDSIEFGLDNRGIFNEKWYGKSFFIDSRLGKLKEKRRLEIN